MRDCLKTPLRKIVHKAITFFDSLLREAFRTHPRFVRTAAVRVSLSVREAYRECLKGGLMAKARTTTFFCKECGAESAKWAGQCPSCRAWNTLVEAPYEKTKAGGIKKALSPFDMPSPVTFSQINAGSEERFKTGINEFDRTLGGGIVKGSLVLLGGDPGIGKSTLLTQVCKALSDKGENVLYITGEESLSQIKLRADRIGSFTENMRLLCETDLELIKEVLKKEVPKVCIIDSVQTMYSPDASGTPGSPSQLKECCNILLSIAKGLGICIFLIGHVTKEGTVAGPRMVEHMVDTVLYFEGDALGAYRILRSVKNRFGSTNEIGVFEMGSFGLNEVKNPSAFMLEGRPLDSCGTSVSCTIAGTRPILLEIQSLVSPSVLGNPRRSATGFDYGRMNLLIAVLEKRLGLKISTCDAYLNIVGGIRVNETALDLAASIAIASGYLDFVVDPKLVAFGEVGLSGEIRSVNQIETRIKEAAKMGFEKCIVPAAFRKPSEKIPGIKIIPAANLAQAIEAAKM